jgi:predicted lipoprotein with Yx(FWY)xxD motif
MPICVNENMFTRTQGPWRIDSARAVWRPTARRLATIATAIGAGIATLAALPAMGASAATASTGTEVSTVSTPYGTVLKVGSGQFSGYTLYEFTRNTPSGCTTKVDAANNPPLSCTGPEADKTADWPALTTVGKPVAGPGVNKHLLGMVNRKDIGGDQVTYAGKLLYMFDPAPGQYGGVNFEETVAPLPPWHGVWYLASAKNGLPATGPIAISTQKQSDGSTVLTAGMFQGMAGSTGLPIVVYSYSKDSKDHSNCTGTCAVDWPPLLTTAPVQAGTGVSKSSLGVIHRADGTEQIAFDGKPLYLYSEEVPQLDPQTGNPENPATLGTGNGLAGPGHDGTFKLVAASS